MFIQTETTPNPQVLKFMPGRAVLEDGGMEFPNAEGAARSPLASALFALDGVTKVYLGNDFLTVGKSEGREWSHLKAPVLAAVMDHFTSGRPTLLREDETADEIVYEGDTIQIVQEIKDLLDAKIRPAVAQDGGDIVFDRFNPETGMVYLHMRGACSGCPSSAMTLKAGVENMLKHYVPEVTGVEAVL